MRSTRFCACAAISTFLVATATSSTLNASSLVQVIQPNKQVQQGWLFEVNRTRDRNPLQSKFKIEIIPKNAQLPSRFTVFLSSVQVKYKGTAITIKGIRKVDCTAKQTIVCDFTIPNAALENPDLGFVLEVPVFVNRNGKQIPMPSSSLLYFKLKDIPQSDFSSWKKLWLYIGAIADWFSCKYAS